MTDSASTTVSSMILTPVAIEQLVNAALPEECTFREMELRAENVRLAAFAHNISAYLFGVIDLLSAREDLPQWVQEGFAEVWLHPMHDKAKVVVEASNRLVRD